MSTYSREDVAAFDLFARLQGIDPSQLATDTETLEEPAGIDYDIEFEDELWMPLFSLAYSSSSGTVYLTAGLGSAFGFVLLLFPLPLLLLPLVFLN